MSNPFDESGESERLWYQSSSQHVSDPTSRPRPFEPVAWSANEGAGSGDWTTTRNSTSDSRTPPRIRLRTPQRSMLDKLSCGHLCSCNWVIISILIGIFVILLGGGFSVWSYERHVQTSSQLSMLETTMKEIQNNVNSAQDKIRDMQSTMIKMESLIKNASDTSNIGLYNNMVKIKKELLDDMNQTTHAVHKQLVQSEDKVDKLVDATTHDLNNMRSNVSHMVSEMKTTMNKTITRIHSIVNVAKSAIDLEVRNVSKQEQKYVADTKKQFAAENDFVKYQLAGIYRIFF